MKIRYNSIIEIIEIIVVFIRISIKIKIKIKLKSLMIGKINNKSQSKSRL
jgi:hypothetical protein